MQLKNDIPKLIFTLERVQDDVLHELGKFYVKEMKKRVPVDTGNLRDKCGYKVEANKLYLTNDTDYAGYVEFGTYKMMEQPFMRPAVLETVGKALNVIKRCYDAKFK